MDRFSFSRGCVSVFVTLMSIPAWAVDPVVVQGPQAVVTASDVRADAERVPADVRATVLVNPDNIAQAASNLYVRRVMADRAQADGLAADADVAAALRIARDRILSDAYLARLDQKLNVTDASLEGQARNLYASKPDRYVAPEQVRVRHILIGKNEENAEAKAQKLLAELKAGADFETLARENSIDKGSAARGGDLGLFPRGRMVPEFEKAAFELKNPKDLSDIVQTQFGFHILQLVERKPAGVRPFAEVRAEIMKELRSTLQTEARSAEAQRIQVGAKLVEQAVKDVAESFKSKR